jgi:hypothetical protein
MKILLKLVLIIGVATFLFGCASVKMASKEEDTALKKFALPPSDKAGLYIFRNSFLGQAVSREIYVDSVFIGKTANGVYFYLEISPGTHTISTESEFGENSVMLEVEGGKNYFAEQYIKMGIFSGGAGIEMVDESVGMQQVLDCELAEKQTNQ